MNIKTGIDYFSVDVDIYQDDKIRFVSARFGMKGEAIIFRLLCKIYRNGYYEKWDDDTALLFARSVGDGCTDSLANDVVYELVKRGFFDKGIFDRFGILTSRGIQKRYFEATTRRKEVEVSGAFLLANTSKYQNVSITGQNVYILNDDVNITGQNVSESKVKETESKVNGAAPAGASSQQSFDQFWNKYPRKVAKDKARKAFEKIKPAVYPELMSGLEKSLASAEWQKNITAGTLEFVPHAATWLNGKRWNDEPGKPSPHGKPPAGGQRPRESFERPTGNYDYLATDPFADETGTG